MTLRLTDVRGVTLEMSITPRRPFTVVVVVPPDAATALRRLVHADVLRRAVDRHGAVGEVVVDRDVDAAVAELARQLNCRPPLLRGVRGDVVVADSGSPDDFVSAPPPFTGDVGAGLASRLAMLDGVGDVAPAEAELTRWRMAVAAWAELPSKPMCADFVEWCHAAVDDNLDTPRLVALMREVEAHPDLPPGSKFETFAHLDTLVGLDLAADVGLSR